MTRGLMISLALGVGGLLALWLLLGVAAGMAVMPSYLAAWLSLLAIPLGALALLMGREWLGLAETPLAAALRALVPLMLPAAVLAIPVLAARGSLYPLAETQGGFAAWWTAPGTTTLRDVLFLLLWLGLAALFRRPPQVAGGRGGLAGFGLGVHLVIGTLVAADWIGAADPALVSSALGLIVLVAQAVAALALAALMARGHAATAAAALTMLLGAWLFLVFTQYLIVWSANLPAEAGWYLRRGGMLAGTGGIAAIAVPALGAGAMAARSETILRLVAGLALALMAGFMFWLVTPGSRGSFGLGIADVVASVALAGLVGAAVLMLPRAAPGAEPSREAE